LGQCRPELAVTVNRFRFREDIRGKPVAERKAILRKVLQRTRRGIQYVEHTEGDGVEMFKAICKLGLEGIVSKKLNAPYKSGPSKAWLKIKNPKAPAATRAVDGLSRPGTKPQP
jgi:bifunctional non-homologous end joining protein LigD